MSCITTYKLTDLADWSMVLFSINTLSADNNIMLRPTGVRHNKW